MLGRIILKVTTDIKANPKQVITLLEQAAHEQPLVQTKPPPVAVLEGFGPGQIDFTLNVTLTDVKTNLGRTLTLDELKAVTRIDTMTAAD